MNVGRRREGGEEERMREGGEGAGTNMIFDDTDGW